MAYRQDYDVESQKHGGRSSLKAILALPLRFFRNRLIPKLLALVTISYALFIFLYASYAYTHLPNTSIPTYLSLGIISSPNQPNTLKSTFFAPYKFTPEYGTNLLDSEGDNYQFAWKHWVNLTDLAHASKDFKFSEYAGKYFNKPPRRAGSQADLRRLGQTFLASYAHPVDKIIFLATNKTVVLPPLKTQREASLLDKASALLHLDVDNYSLDPYQEELHHVLISTDRYNLLPPLAGNVNAKSLADRVAVSTSTDAFRFNADNLTSPSHLNKESEFHAVFVKKAIAAVRRSPKFFYELWLSRNAVLGVHYDWRFFRQVRRGEDATHTLHHLVRTWSAFTHQEGVVTWIAHGALLGWFWNGLTLPWDSDIDVQMPVMELDRLARRYNNTIIVQDPKEGDGRYLLEVSPGYVERSRGNGNNVIDARFIDMRSGIYLDITGLAYNHPVNRDLVGCKTPHYYNVDDIYPLRLTSFEGVPVYVPNNVHRVLRDEYWGFENPVFQMHAYNKDLRLWTGRKQCETFTNTTLKYDTASGEINYYGACENNDLWSLYNKTQEITALHNEELGFLKSHEQTKSVATKLPKELAKYVRRFKPTYPNPRYIEGHANDV